MAEGHPNYSSNDGGSLELMHFLGISPAALPTSAPLTDPRRARTLVETHFSLRPPVMPNRNTFGLMTTSGTQIIQTQPTSGTLFQTQPLDLRSSPTPLPRPANTFTWRQNHVENIWRPRPNHTENRRDTFVELSIPVEQFFASARRAEPQRKAEKNAMEKNEEKNALEWAQDHILKLEREIQTLKESRSCKVCMDQEVSHVFIPCGHAICCGKCVGNVKRCPMCRASIQGSLIAYFS